MTIEQLKEIIANQEQQLLDHGKNLMDEYTNGWKPDTSTPAWLQPMPLSNPTYIDYETLRKTRVADKHKEAEYQEVMANVSKYISNMQRSPIQALLDDLFYPSEKVEYLISIGYRKIEGSSYLTKGEPDPEFKRTFTVEEAFLEEMKIKLKNVLLSKQALKFKI